jgi:hypothetical protein
MARRGRENHACGRADPRVAWRPRTHGTVSGRNVARDIALILAFVAAGIGVYQIVNLESRLGDVRSEFARASVGMGLYSVVGDGVLGVVGGFLKR